MDSSYGRDLVIFGLGVLAVAGMVVFAVGYVVWRIFH